MTSARAPEPSELRSLLRAWPLESVGSITPAAGGATNWVYRVEAGSAVAFLKIYQKADRATALREHALIASVRQRAIPAASPLPCRTGETLIERDGWRCEHQFGGEQCRRAGRGELGLDRLGERQRCRNRRRARSHRD